MITDSDRIEFLERQFSLMKTKSHNRVHFRESKWGRGARLHHTHADGWQPNYATVREAIDAAIGAPAREGQSQ